MKTTEDQNGASLKRVVRPKHRDHKMMLRSLGANITAARLKSGISMGTMAKLSGVSKGNCSKIERGGNITALSLYKLCWSIGIHPRDVLPEYRPNDQALPKGGAKKGNDEH
jgi:DNA-binding Xre family transcriptional regulator